MNNSELNNNSVEKNSSSNMNGEQNVTTFVNSPSVNGSPQAGGSFPSPSVMGNTMPPVANNVTAQPTAPQNPTPSSPIVNNETPKVAVTPNPMSSSTVPNATYQQSNMNPQMTGQPPIPSSAPENNAYLNENLKKVEVEYTPPSKFKTISMILIFVLLIGFVIFLPQITDIISHYESNNSTVEKITSGELICSLNTSTSSLDKSYENTFIFIDNQLEKAELVTETRGDVGLDAQELDALADNCKELSTAVDLLEGISVRCSYTNAKFIQTEIYDLEQVDFLELSPIYAEAGLTILEYTYHENIDKVERNMNASGYTCNRSK